MNRTYINEETEPNLLFGIVCFREEFWNCESFLTLVASFNKVNLRNTLNIIIYDNTDDENWNLKMPESCDNINIVYVSDKSNSGIAAAFNCFGDHAITNNYEWIVFLDQDTSLPQNFYEFYLQNVKSSHLNIGFPLVFSDNKLISPSYYRNFRTSVITPTPCQNIILSGVTAINSGMLIKTRFLMDSGGYNSNLKIDFCDHEFISRLNNKSVVADILPVTLNQNFSVDTNSIEKALFRYKLFVQDLKAFKKINSNDYKISLFVDFPHLLRLTLKYKSLDFFKQRFLQETHNR